MGQTIQDKLRAWGVGKGLRDAPNGCGKPGYVRQILNPGEQADRAAVQPLPDDEHIRVDEVVSELKNRKPDHHRVIVYAYQKDYLDQRIADKTKWKTEGGDERRSRSWVRTTRENAEHWIEGRLD